MSDEEFIVYGEPLKPRHACAVCGHVLDYVVDVGWRHNSGDKSLYDHPAVPVPADEISVVSMCDFCYEPDPRWILPVKSFVNVKANAGSGGNWAACDGCVRLINRNEWSALMRRVKVAWQKRHGTMLPPVEQHISKMYRAVRKNMTGAPFETENSK